MLNENNNLPRLKNIGRANFQLKASFSPKGVGTTGFAAGG
jgi:hypothetical protein